MPTVLALALAVGITLGLFGGGGSILTVPVLAYGAGLEPKPAIATSLLVVGVTSAAALVPHARAGNVRWRNGAGFGVAGMAGAYAGGRLGQLVAGELLLVLFAAMMVAASVAMWRGRSLPAEAAPPRARLAVVADGLVVGLANGLVGAGGGFLVVPALVLLGGMPMRAAIGTSLFVIALKSLAGFAGYVHHVRIDYALALSFASLAVVGSWVGVRMVDALHPDRLRRGFAVFVLAMAGLVVYRELGAIVAARGG